MMFFHRGIRPVFVLCLVLALMSACAGLKPSSSSEASSDTDTLQARSFDAESRDRIRFEKLFFEAQQAKLAGNPEIAVQEFRKVVKYYPKVAAPQYELGRLLVAGGSVSEGAFYLNNAYELDPDNTWYIRELADTYKEDRNFSKAARFYTLLTEKGSKNPEVFFELANMYIMNKQLEKAIDAYDKMETIIGINESVRFQKQKLYLRLDQPGKAAQEIKGLIDAYPNKISYYQRLASIYQSNGMIDEAEGVYKNMLNKDPDNAEVHLGLAELYDQQGKEKKAQEELKKAFDSDQLAIDVKVRFLYNNFLRQQRISESRMAFGTELARFITKHHPREAKAHALLGDFLYNRNLTQEAEAAYEEALKYNQDIFAVWQQLLFIHASKSNYQELATLSDQVIELFPNQPIGFYFNGLAKNQLEQYEEAIEVLKTGVAITVDNPSLKSQMYANLAEAYHYQEKHRQSDEYFEKALEIDPDDATTLNNFAYYLSVRGEKLDRAEKLSQRSLDVGGQNPSFLDTYGWIQYKKGNYKQAAEYIKMALDKAGPQPELLDHYGDVLLKLGKEDQAVKYWRQAVEAGGPEDTIEKKIRQQVNP